LQAGGQAGLFMSLEAPNGDQLTGITAPGAASSVQLGNGPITLNPNTLVDLGGPSPLLTLDGLINPLSGGEMVKLVLQFATAGTVTLTVPVEPAGFEFATYSPAPTPTASASLSVSLSGHKHKAKKKAQAIVSASPAGAP
jgi:hypothetical protein